MNLNEVIRFAPLAINCFTGSLAQLSKRGGAPIDEAQLLEAGDGYLYRTGLDEWGMPEYTFEVENVGLRACRALGAHVARLPIDTDWVTQLKTLLIEHAGVVVWVNSVYLDYAPVYSTDPGYMHAVLVIGINDTSTHVKILDSLVVDNESYACEAWLSIEAFANAHTDRVRTETYDHMGYFIVMHPNACPPAFDVRANLLRQARLYLSEDGYRGALPAYRELCMEHFRGSPEHAAIAARRLFDHIVILYVIPGLSLLGRSLQRAGCEDALGEITKSLIHHWRALSVLALKLEATNSPLILSRVEKRFDVLDSLTVELWQNLNNMLQES